MSDIGSGLEELVRAEHPVYKGLFGGSDGHVYLLNRDGTYKRFPEYLNHDGRYRFWLRVIYCRPCRHGRKLGVNRFIAECFKGLCAEPKWEARHLDNNPVNNKPSNLRWGPKRLNDDDRIGQPQPQRVYRTAADRAEIVGAIASGLTISTVASMNGITRKAVRSILTRQRNPNPGADQQEARNKRNRAWRARQRLRKETERACTGKSCNECGAAAVHYVREDPGDGENPGNPESFWCADHDGRSA